MTTLKDFISETLAAITESVLDFETKYQATTGASAMPRILVNPGKQDQVGDFSFEFPKGGSVIVSVRFDLLVEAQETETNEREISGEAGAAGRLLSVVTANVDVAGAKKASSEAADNRANRVNFTLPLRLPDRPQS